MVIYIILFVLSRTPFESYDAVFSDYMKFITQGLLYIHILGHFYYPAYFFKGLFPQI